MKTESWGRRGKKIRVNKKWREKRVQNFCFRSVGSLNIVRAWEKKEKEQKQTSERVSEHKRKPSAM